MDFQQILFGILVVVNLVSFSMVAHDKRKAANGHNTERTPEGIFFFMGTIFGSIGIYAGMFVFRHKVRKWYFQIGIPMLILQNVATVYLLKELFA